MKRMQSWNLKKMQNFRKTIQNDWFMNTRESTDSHFISDAVQEYFNSSTQPLKPQSYKFLAKP